MPFETQFADRDAIFSDILIEISTTDKGLERICTPSSGYPTSRTIYKWMLESDDMVQRYARAKEMQTQVLADQIMDIADTPQEGVKTVSKPTGEEETRGDMLEHRKLRIDSRKWLLSKLAPKKYGDKLDMNMTGEVAIKRVVSDL